MTDLEITRACAQAMGIQTEVHPLRGTVMRHWFMDANVEKMYDPFHDDAQAMALVKRFGLNILRQGNAWTVMKSRKGCGNEDLNRAICEWVARMQAKGYLNAGCLERSG